jgi:predicted  nucleic acid-binding Zn-ribbon protein
MGYMNWEQIKKEVQNELEKGLAVIKNGVIVIQKKAEELSDEGKRQYRMMSTKAKIHNSMRDLGARVYILMSQARTKNPALDVSVKDIMARIKGLEAELAKLEGKAGASSVRAVPNPSMAAAHAKTRRKTGVTSRPKTTRKVNSGTK